MPYPTLVLHLDDDARSGVRLGHAIGFACRFASRLVGVSCPRPATGSGDGALHAIGVDAFALELERARQAAREHEHTFRRRCDSAGVESFESVVVDENEAARALVRHGRCSDLVILGQPDPSQPEHARRRAVLEHVVLHNARPTLVLPYAGRFATIGERVLVAWDDSRQAARAVAEAMPLLERAGSVHLVQFDPSLGRGAVADESRLAPVARWLSSHGVAAHARMAYAGADIGNAILSCAADVDADLLVMGAWGHRRITERVLGGATRTVLAGMTVPVLMAH